eukprot:CAMPEP_0113950796 /NCGR_PEP_ID=MMETSP1339-20121228/82601_1 /TAXON_ID=94617 /ORGANISM="Fibrocapsa japonica" /LENGTH=214 /DNA_ID=CAMNT_0000958767 /DNA_START=51 /DNA_END=695 /DNA_ORIENTATION=- /assembly_acc=CAM_ASM_000762
MTPEAQAALRRTMEVHSKVTRFCLVCNYVTRIIEPLASRCAKFRFQGLPEEAMKNRLVHIATAEQVSVSEESLDTIVKLSGGDMRKAVTTLQSAQQMFAGSATSITEDDIAEISGSIPHGATTALWTAMKSGRFDNIENEVEKMACEGFPIGALLHRLQEEVIEEDGIEDIHKAAICLRIAEADKCLNDGASEALQLLDIAAVIMRQVCGMQAC